MCLRNGEATFVRFESGAGFCDFVQLVFTLGIDNLRGGFRLVNCEDVLYRVVPQSNASAPTRLINSSSSASYPTS